MSDASYKAVLHGCLDNLPTLNSRLVRIFISSTFTDTREERNVLLEDVYPKLKLHCKKEYGMDFQLVDMRWGVPVESADDHQATELCLQEIRNCQRLSTGPNFVTFLNQKHGYRPLQVTIPEAEFDNLYKSLEENGHDTSLFTLWYKKDTNQLPPIYVLQPISSIIPGYKDKDNKEAKAQWNDVYDKLRAEFKFASDACFQKNLISEVDRHKYYMSVTEAEIFNGILKLPDSAADHCLCFVRIIKDITSHLDHDKAWRFIDVLSSDSKSLDTEAQTILSKLRDEKIVEKLQNTNISRHTVQWSEKDGINRQDHDSYLSTFKDSFFNSMVDKIDKAVKQQRSLIMDELYIEVLQHLNMARERCSMFYGRENILLDIKCYLSEQCEDPVILYGQSGCGKTSIMAQTAHMVPSFLQNAVVVLRFLGTSPDSSNLRRLLHSLCEQIVVCYGKERTSVPEDFEELKDFFSELLKLGTKEKPLVIILDSLDQLARDHNAYKLHWLPRKLPPFVKFFVSTYTEASDLLGTLKNIYLKQSFIHVPVFSQELSTQVLKAWLKKSNRTLSDEQFSLVENVFIKCTLPLFVKLTFDQVLVWRSYYILDKCMLMNTVQDSINTLFSQLEKKHGNVLVTRALAYVTASMTGISETELEDLLSLDDDVLTNVFQIHVPPLRRIPPLLWVRIRHDISQYLVDKEVDEVRSFFWYHRQFFETAERRYLSDEKLKEEIHSLMADYYLGKWVGVEKPFRYTPEQMKRVGVTSPEGKADRRISAQPMIYSADSDGKNVRYNKRKLNKLPYHLFEANRHQELRSLCLLNFEWNEIKLKAISLQEVLLDLALCGEKEGILHKALKASQQTLRKFPETLAMEISGRLLALLPGNVRVDEMKLLENSLTACAQKCRLVPYQPCFGIPSESEMYTIENAKLPINPKISEISSDSTHFATLSADNEVLIWDVNNGELDAVIELRKKEDGILNVMSKSFGKDVLIIGTINQIKTNPVYIVNFKNCALEEKIELEKKYSKIAFFDDLKFDITSDRLLVTVLKQSADVFDRQSGKLLHEFDVNPDEAILIAEDKMILFHPKQTNMYTIYRMDTFEFVYQISCKETPKAIFMNAQRDFGCIVLEKANKVDLVNLQQGPNVGQIAGTIDLNKVKDLTIQRVQLVDDLCLITGIYSFVLYDLKSKKVTKEVRIPESYDPNYRVLEFHTVLTPDLEHIIAGYDKNIILFSVATGKILHSIEATKSRISRLHISPAGGLIVTTNTRNNHVTAWDIMSLKNKPRSYQPLSLNNSVRYMCADRLGTTAVCRSMNSTEFAVVDVSLGQTRCFISKDYEAMTPCITEDGKYAVLREYHSDRCLKVWDTVSGNLVTTFPISSLNLKAFVLGMKSENMVVVTESENTGQNSMELYSLPSGNQTGVKIPLGKYNLMQLVFAENDKYIIVGIEEQLHPGVKIYSRSYSTKTGDEFQTYDNMHPKHIQRLTVGSDCFLGPRINTDKAGNKSWETAVLNIETGDTMVTFKESPVSVLSIGWEGHYGIDRDRNIFNIKTGDKHCQFDTHLGEQKKSVPRPLLTTDENFAFWLDVGAGVVKVGNVQTKQVIGMSPIHSIPMNITVTSEKVVIIGCEDGRIMMLQMIEDKKDADGILKRTLKHSMRKGIKVKNSSLKALQRNDTNKEPGKTKANEKSSTACYIL
ncbi:NACHT and WD repeat domain-containing protein 2-like [Ruditapes philippinarum]|uniref:NACHT and WD repeat domain-containing protein 2-like n=1 Tax=Ruditapes philippinarum TaxID=129788 RepID=UPI00295BC0CA|nr:NACHT and WD repeat domain-containing protein 2-like [Ruditapes philippinarum]